MLTGVCAMRFFGKCISGAIADAGKKIQPTSPPSSQLPSASSPLPSSPVSSAPTQATVDREEHSALAHTPAQSAVSYPSADKPRELRRERDEETTGGGSAPKRRKITPTPPPIPSLAPQSASVLGAVPSPEVAEAQKVTEVVVPADQPSLSQSENLRQSEPGSTSDSAPSRLSPELLYPDDANAATADVATAPRKIGMQHMRLVYEPTLQCRMCLCVVFPSFSSHCN